MPYDGTNYPKDETAKILLKAVDVIRKRGWAQGVYENMNGNVCILGAIRVVLWDDASGRDNIHVRDSNIAARRLESYLNCSVDAWNDTTGRTKEEAIAALEGAAAHVEAKVK